MGATRVHRGLGAFCGVTLLVGVLAAATYDDGGDEQTGTVGPGSTTTAAPAPTEPGATVPGGEGGPADEPGTGDPTAAPGDGAAPGGGAAPGDGGAPAAATPVPPAVGEYHYDVTSGTGTVAPTVAEVRADPAAPTDRLVGFQGASLGLVERYRWQPDGVYVLGGTFTALGDSSCQWQPPVLQLRAPVVVGGTWEGASTCVAATQVGEISVRASTRTEIVELVDTEVAGRTRRAARVLRQEEQEVSLGSETVRSSARYDDLVDVATGVVISSTASATTEGGQEETSQRRLTRVPDEW